MTIESFLTRELDIRFIDARSITNEAKVNLKIQGYPTKYQEQRIRQESLRIFSKRPEASKETMRRLSASLHAVKIREGSSGEFSDFDESSIRSFSFSETSSPLPGSSSRKGRPSHKL